jgi:hypothetical protein
MNLGSVVAKFDHAPFRWWISGCLALELHLGRSWRAHEDTDIGIVRSDVPLLASVLQSWDIHVAAAGQLSRWSGGSVRAATNENNLWCRQSPASPWELDITVSDGDDDTWIYRRDHTIRLPWDEAVLRANDGTPYLAPELQLLFKSKTIREKDELDARQAIPALEPERRRRLATLLPTVHPWHELLGDRDN